MAKNIANVVIATDSFATWVSVTNQTADAFTKNALTANAAPGGATVTGNSHLFGIFAANTIVANNSLRGGNVSHSNLLTISSNTNFTGEVINSAANVYIGAANVYINTTSFVMLGVSTLTGNATFKINATNTNIQLLGNATASNLTFSANAVSVVGNVSITNATSVANTIAVTGAATFSNNLTVSGSVTNTVNFNASGDVTVGGNLAINGTLTTINTTTLNISDPLIRLANNNLATDTADVGFFGSFGNNTVTQFTGLFRDQSDSAIYKLFSGAIPEPVSTVNTANVNFAFADLQLKTLFAATVNTANAQITGGAITGITDLAVVDGGTGVSVFANNGIVFGSNTLSLSVTAAGTAGQVLTAGAGGVPAFATLDGGSF